MTNIKNIKKNYADIPEYVTEKSRKDMKLSIKITDPLLKTQLNYYSYMEGSQFNKSMWVAHLIAEHVHQLDSIAWPESIRPHQKEKPKHPKRDIKSLFERLNVRQKTIIIDLVYEFLSLNSLSLSTHAKQKR